MPGPPGTFPRVTPRPPLAGSRAPAPSYSLGTGLNATSRAEAQHSTSLPPGLVWARAPFAAAARLERAGSPPLSLAGAAR